MKGTTDLFCEQIEINGKIYSYVMTSSTEALKNELEKLGCRLPWYNDYRLNPELSYKVRKKMAEHKAKWSLTVSNGAAVLNYFKADSAGGGTPYIVHLSELIDSSRISKNFYNKIIMTLGELGQTKLPSLASEWSPLMVAVSQRKTEIVRYLLENGAFAGCSDSNGFTPLMLAAFLNEAEMIRLLIKHGADVNARSKNGFSALIYAIYVNSLEAVKALKENGADLAISIHPKIIEEKRSFLETLEFYISAYSLNGLADTSLIWKNGALSKQLFSKIRSSRKDYHPHKETVFQLAVGLRLTLVQTESLLASAGYFFEEKNPVDRIVKSHISRLDFDIHKINSEVWKETGTAFLKE